jgi:uncharacterized protein with NAD-binding domain and iron-sulfur cluster
MSDPREHVAILGGGVGGCMAAYWLTATPELRAKYRVTLYQTGWRLGGKGASSRSGETNRSEEHGPHVWFGFYENAFKTLRACLDRHKEMGLSVGDCVDWDQFFAASREGVFYHEDKKGDWHPWRMELEEYPGSPGDGTPALDIRSTLWRMADQLADNVRVTGAVGSRVLKVIRWASKFLERPVNPWKPGTCPVGVNPGDPSGRGKELSEYLVNLAGSEQLWYGELIVGRLLKWVLDWAGRRLRKMSERDDLSEDDLREICLADLYRTCLRGALVDVLVRDKTFKDLDHMEFLQWLKSHGAIYHDLRYSPYLRGYYDTPFAFSGGKTHDTTNANFAAGAALRGFFRIFFGYKGAYVYRMTLGMGECVFIPLYRVLKDRGVSFEFFHKVEKLVPDADGNRVARIEFNRQARLKPELSEYYPIREIVADHPEKGKVTWPTWPDHPMADQLDPDSLPAPGDPGMESDWSLHRVETVVLTDAASAAPGAKDTFDHVILAIPPQAHPRIAAGLLAESPRYKTMVDTSESIRTIACQFWFSGGGDGVDGLRWDSNEYFCEYALAGSAPDPFNIVVEATPILRTECTTEAKHLIYLCGPEPDDPNEPAPGTDPGYPAREKARVKEVCRKWLDAHSALWPGICLPNSTCLDPKALYHPDPDATDEERFDWQYFRINIDPSERYVLSTNKGTPHRLFPWESGFNNLYFAGDWCRNSIDIGCVESATTSAMLAVNALTKGSPSMAIIDGQQYI